MSVDKEEIVGTAGFILGLLLLLGVATCFSGCWYEDNDAYLEGYHDGQLDSWRDIDKLEDDVHELQWRLSECLYPPTNATE